MPDFTVLPLYANIGVFLLAAVIIATAGSRLTRVADQIADVTGLGEALTGAILLGAATSLPGIVTTVTAGLDGHPELAVSNAVGGIAAQTAFLAVADLSYRRANLEHAAASGTNMFQAALLITLLALLLATMLAPVMQIWHVHPTSVVLLAVYLYGLHLINNSRNEPMWRPQMTQETRPDVPDDTGENQRSLRTLIIRFAMLATIVAASGWFVERTAVAISEATGVSETVVGGIGTAVVTSLPELVITLAAVRQGALTLAVSGIIGGNAFDTLFVAFGDVAYLDGSIYHATTQNPAYLLALTILMIGVLLMGLVRRQEHGIANIGFEGFLVLVIYIGGFTLLMLNS